MTPYQTALRDGLLAAEQGDAHKREIEETITAFRSDVEAVTRGVVFVRRYDASGALILTVGKGPTSGATHQLCSKLEPDPAGYPVTLTSDLLPSTGDGSRAAASPAARLLTHGALNEALSALLSHPKTGAWLRDALRSHEGLIAKILDGTVEPTPLEEPARQTLAPGPRTIKTNGSAA